MYKLFPLGIIALLAMVFCPIVAHATISYTQLPANDYIKPTNEDNYRIGYWFGLNNFKCATNSDCDFPTKNEDVSDCSADAQWSLPWDTSKNMHPNNSTACIDGYYNGWKDWCKTDAGMCAYFASTGAYPSILKCVQWFQWHIGKPYWHSTHPMEIINPAGQNCTAHDLLYQHILDPDIQEAYHHNYY